MRLFFFFLFVSMAFSQTFTNVANQAGVGVWGDYLAIGDINNDGFQDLYVALDNWGSGNAPDYLFLNNGNGTFTDVYDSVGLLRHPFYGHHPTFGDFNNDGFIDLFIGSDTFYINTGNGTFTPVELIDFIKIPQDYVLGAVILDINNDGLLDLAFSHNPRGGVYAMTLLMNKGNLNFEKKYTTDFGIPFLAIRLFWADLNNDIYPDLILVNPSDYYLNIYENQGNFSFAFRSKIIRLECAFGDINNDGYLDVMVTNSAGGIKLYKNNGNFTFEDITNSSGLNVYVSYGGPLMADFNNDGYMDIYISQNDTIEYLFINNKNETFTNIVPDSVFMRGGSYTGIFDYDRDGDLDLYVINSSTIPYNDWKSFLYRNNLSDRYDGTNNWIILTLRGTISNKDGVGARVESYSQSGSEYLRQIRYVGMPYVSQSMLPVHFGLGSSQVIDSIVIKWPSGIRQVLRNILVNQYLTIIEDSTLTNVERSNENISFNLDQNYPNPFNPKTKIRFTIPDVTLSQSKGDLFTTLKVYDLLGREIATLVNEPKQAGEYEVEFDASKYDLTSGVYIYELRSGSFKSAKKFVLMK